MPLVRFDHLADLLIPNLRRALTQCEFSSLTHAKLAYVYIDTLVMTELQRIAFLSKEAAEKEVAAYEQRT